MITKKYLADGKDGYTSLSEAKVLVDDEETTNLPTLLRNHFSMLSVLNGFVMAKQFHECNLQRAKNRILERLESRKKKKLDKGGKLNTGLAREEQDDDLETDMLTATCKTRVMAHGRCEKNHEEYTINPQVEGRIKLTS